MEQNLSNASTSTSDHGQLVKDNLRKFDKLMKNMGRKLLTRPYDTIFVPSTIPPCSSYMSQSPSPSDTTVSSQNASEHRKLSAPSFVGLTIDTSGGETAGLGYGWVTAPDAPEPVHAVASVVRAQQVALHMVKERILWTKQQINSCRKDEQLIADFIADAFVHEMDTDRSKHSHQKLQEELKSLEEEVEGLRKISPKAVPPPRPARPNHRLTWICVRCLEENVASSYRCNCSFPRPTIDPLEAIRCSCPHCTPTSADRMFLSPTPGDGDWLLVNKLGIKNNNDEAVQ